MTTRDTLNAAVDAYGADQFSQGAQSRDAEVADLNEKIAELEKQADPYSSFYQLEAPAAGSTIDPGPVIQKALDSHGDVTIGPGNWDSRSPLLHIDGQHLHLHDEDTNLWRAYSSGTGTQQAFIRNRDFTKTIDGLAFTGPGNIAARQGMKGCLFGLKVDNLTNDGWGTTYWTKGRHTQSVGNNHRYTNPKPWRCDPNDTSGSGGLRYGGGDGFHAIGLDIWSGDDGCQLVPAGGAGDPLTNYADITNAIYERCISRSTSARPFVVGLQGDVQMRTSIKGWKFIDCYGYGGGVAVNIANHSPSLGSITDGEFLRCTVDQRYAGTDAKPNLGQPSEFFILRDPGTGIVDRIDASTSVVILSSRRADRTKPLYKPQGDIGASILPPIAA